MTISFPRFPPIDHAFFPLPHHCSDLKPDHLDLAIHSTLFLLLLMIERLRLGCVTRGVDSYMIHIMKFYQDADQLVIMDIALFDYSSLLRLGCVTRGVDSYMIHTMKFYQDADQLVIMDIALFDYSSLIHSLETCNTTPSPSPFSSSSHLLKMEMRGYGWGVEVEVGAGEVGGDRVDSGQLSAGDRELESVVLYQE
ncbi:hypothetical protein L6452_30243 [Arctium lappa]|uniref:Uncharacterized protein n=1 Tax=Arctium lappa TaxID=4217 RepID=A0ACB8ZH31_ARCLA|nr:hypothetical protein L6452_30243 [Arctium lappa]